MKYLLYSSLTAAALIAAPFQPSLAGGCFVDPVHEHSSNGSINSAVFMRDHACMEGSSILLTIPGGAGVKVFGETDGWYYVEWNGGRGWVGAQFVNITSRSTSGSTSYDSFMQAYPSRKSTSGTPAPAPSVDPNLIARLKGYILLQVESHGEAWYVNPTDGSRYYMKDGATAYQMMRSFGLGMNEADYARLENGDTALRSRLRGRIVLRVHAHGEAYYIHPKTLAVHYLKDGPTAYGLMRFHSLGITNADLSRITSREVPIK